MVEATIRLSDGLAAAVGAYLRDYPESPSIPELAEHLLVEFLASQGYVTDYVPLRMPVGPSDSGDPTDSVEHDRLFAEAWMSRRDRE